MSNFVPLETIDRRSIIRGLALAITSAGMLDLDAAQHVHTETASEKAKGAYKVKAFQPAEYKTLQRFAELIVPKDDVSGSALDAGAPEFIDLLCSQNEKLADIFHGGLAWLDAEMRKRYKSTLRERHSGATDRDAGCTRRSRRGSAPPNEELVYPKSPSTRISADTRSTAPMISGRESILRLGLAR